MSKVKICGIRRQEDITFINKYLPDYIGFVFAESKRRVTCGEAVHLLGLLDKRVRKVGVFVNESLDSVIGTACACRLDIIQLHGDETGEYIDELYDKLAAVPNLNTGIWKALRIKSLESLKQMKCYKVNTFLLDTFVENCYGGAGKVFDWSIAAEASRYGEIVLAGGLHSSNIEAAVKTARPYAVDVSSGVETNGFKDEIKIRDFIKAVRGES